MNNILGYLKIAGLVTVVLNFFLIGHAYYYDKVAKNWVSSIEGTYVPDSWKADGDEGLFLVKWNEQEYPPACRVTINSVFISNGYAVNDLGAHLDADDMHTIHLSKNGKISIEPVGHTAFWFVDNMGGTWKYKLEFTFHCSAISKSTWFFWLNLDKTYTTKPIIIEINK